MDSLVTFSPVSNKPLCTTVYGSCTFTISSVQNKCDWCDTEFHLHDMYVHITLWYLPRTTACGGWWTLCSVWADPDSLSGTESGPQPQPDYELTSCSPVRTSEPWGWNRATVNTSHTSNSTTVASSLILLYVHITCKSVRTARSGLLCCHQEVAVVTFGRLKTWCVHLKLLREQTFTVSTAMFFLLLLQIPQLMLLLEPLIVMKTTNLQRAATAVALCLGSSSPAGGHTVWEQRRRLKHPARCSPEGQCLATLLEPSPDRWLWKLDHSVGTHPLPSDLRHRQADEQP